MAKPLLVESTSASNVNVVSYDQVLRGYDMTNFPLSLQWSTNNVSDISIETLGGGNVTFVLEGSNNGTDWKELAVYETDTPATIIQGAFAPTVATSAINMYKPTTLSYSLMRLRRAVYTTTSATKTVQIYIKRTMPVNAITFWGDSMTAGSGSDAGYTMGEQVGYHLPDYTIYNRGIGSQKSDQILARQSGVRISLPTVVDNTTAGRAVTSLTADILKNPTTSNAQIPGLYKGYSTLLAFVAATPGYTIRTLGIPNTISNIDNTLFVSYDALNSRNNINVFWYGRNDAANGNGSFSTVLPNIQKSVDYLANPKRFVVIGVAPNTSETIGTAFKATLDAYNTSLQTAYPNNYVSAYAPTTTELSELGITPSAQDLIDISNGIFPASMMVDATHFTSVGYRIIAKRVLKKIQELKYV